MTYKPLMQGEARALDFKALKARVYTVRVAPRHQEFIEEQAAIRGISPYALLSALLEIELGRYIETERDIFPAYPSSPDAEWWKKYNEIQDYIRNKK